MPLLLPSCFGGKRSSRNPNPHQVATCSFLQIELGASPDHTSFIYSCPKELSWGRPELMLRSLDCRQQKGKETSLCALFHHTETQFSYACHQTSMLKQLLSKATMRYHLTLIRMPKKTKKTEINNCWQGYGENGTLVHCWWQCKIVQPL